MTDISIASPLDGEPASAAASQCAFYVVSRRKLAILFIATMGAYCLYWFYKNWSQYRNHGSAPQEARDGIWPVARAIFLVFFIHSLFRKVKELGRERPQVAAWNNNLHAWWMVILYIAMNVSDRLSRRSIGSPYTDIFGIAGLFILLFAYLKAQAMINASCNDPEGAGNARLTAANWVWIVLGALVWLGAFIGGFVDGGSGTYAPSSSSF